MQANQYTTVQTPRRVAHWLHFVLSIITLGLWIPVWICVAIYTGIMNARAGRTRVVTTSPYAHPPQAGWIPVSQPPSLPPAEPTSEPSRLSQGQSQTPSGLWLPPQASDRRSSISKDATPPAAPVTANYSEPYSPPPAQPQEPQHRKSRGLLIVLAVMFGAVGVAGLAASALDRNAPPSEASDTREAANNSTPRSTPSTSPANSPTTTTPRTTTTSVTRTTTTTKVARAMPYLEDGVVHYKYQTSLGQDAMSDVTDTTNCDDFWFDVNWWINNTEIIATPDARMFADVMLIVAQELGCDTYQLPDL